LLTGLIRCPQCGRGYIGTAAHGRSSTYRYYTCWSRARYGTTAGCDVHRFNADAIETAITTALLGFYTNHSQLIADAITAFQARHAADSSRQQEELAALTRQLKDTSTAIDRYLIAFEKGTLDDEDTHLRERLATLKTQSKQLRARKAQLEFDLDEPPEALTPADQAKIRDYIRDVLAHGTPNARKAMCEALIHEITIVADDTVRPTFKLPLTGNDEGLALQGPAQPDEQDKHAVRALTTAVDQTWQNKNRVIPVQGPDVAVRAIRRRTVIATGCN
jgi:site-specific DNA recombinase